MGSTEFLSIVLALIARGYVVTIRAVMRNSLRAEVRNRHDLYVGDLQYRDPSDEPNEAAQGISWASGYSTNGPDEVLDIVQELL